MNAQICLRALTCKYACEEFSHLSSAMRMLFEEITKWFVFCEMSKMGMPERSGCLNGVLAAW